MPWLVKDYDELVELPLDHRTAFLLSLVDDRSTIADLVMTTGWGGMETLDVIERLVALGALELHASATR